MGRLTDEEIENIKNLYQRGKGSIQDYARIYRVEVPEILDILGIEGMSTVQYIGDQVDPDEMGPEKNKIQPEGDTVKVPFTLN